MVAELKPIPPQFSDAFAAELEDLFRWRRDVRRFRTTPLPPCELEDLVATARWAPSVGLSQPWRFVRVSSDYRRQLILQNFESANREALSVYGGDRAKKYAQLKLAGLKEAPEHLAVLVDPSCAEGSGLGRRTMPEMLHYSVVCAVHALWLTARVRGIGVGWVSILDPREVVRALAVPPAWELVAYLCLGYPEEEHLDPELERHRWEARAPVVLLDR